MTRLGMAMIGGMLLAATADVTPALAQTSQKDRCLYGDLNGLSSYQVIAACTAVLDAPDTSRGDRVDVFFGRGRAWRFIDRRRALEDLGNAIALDPTDPVAFAVRGSVYLEMRDFDRAIAEYTQAIRLDETTVQIFYLRALAHARKGAYDRAMADYDKAIRLEPIWSKAYEARGAAYMDMGDYDRAFADFDHAFKVSLDHPPFIAAALSSRCMVRTIMGQFEQAIPDCNEAVRLYSNNFKETARNLTVRFSMDYYADAIADVDRPERARHADALFGRGIARLRGGDRTGGNADIAAARALAPGIAERFARYGVRP